MVRVIEGLADDWRRFDQRIEELSSEIEELANRDPACVRLMSVPGIGPIISTRGATSPPGWGSCPSRSPLEIAPFSQHIEAWQSLSTRPIRAGSLGHACEGEPEQMERPRTQVITRYGDCDPAYRYAVRIQGGRVINSGGGQDYQVYGAVGSSGAIRVIVVRGGQWADGSGRTLPQFRSRTMAHIDGSMRRRMDCRTPLIRSLRSVDQRIVAARGLGSCNHELRK